MEKTSYHHGMLRDELIEKGLYLLNSEGEAGFSLRKVAALCNVSHAAPYKHFKNKEELVQAIGDKVTQSFSQTLAKAAKENPGDCISAMGKAYVRFMMEHKDYFRFMFLGDHKLSVKLVEGKFIYQEESPFKVFYKSATYVLQAVIQDEKRRNMTIFQAWSMVHGIANLLINETVIIEGDYIQLLEELIRTNITEC